MVKDTMGATNHNQLNDIPPNKMKLQDVSTPSSRKPKAKKKDSDVVMSSVGPDQSAIQDHQIHRAEGLSISECEQSIHAALAVMAHNQMPKQLYKEEIIERILEFSRHQIMDVMCAYDPSYHALHRPIEEDEDPDAEIGSASKKRHSIKTVKVHKSSFNRVAAAVNNILQKMCTILGLLKDLFLIERLSDGCILQLVKTSFTTFMLFTQWEFSLDADYPTKGHEAATEACCHFWTRVLQRFASVKTQEASELKVMMENLVTVLLTTLNLPEYPASAPILQVLCVLLLQNAGLKSKDIGARTRAIDLLGTIAARLKRDSALCSKDKFWILQELVSVDGDDQTDPKNACSVCLEDRVEKNFFVCQGCFDTRHLIAKGKKKIV
ncbi:hypothetical protein PRUPE_2G279500 [Prunus persica]|uniref:Uncharacterized protein n=1 Tax=Prunus persica TaxID=3760 RepID=A0A251QQW7_PRUPE|nr:hypothetical protein PRUPE_2G279500 [Prunus persica]